MASPDSALIALLGQASTLDTGRIEERADAGLEYGGAQASDDVFKKSPLNTGSLCGDSPTLAVTATLFCCLQKVSKPWVRGMPLGFLVGDGVWEGQGLGQSSRGRIKPMH